MIGFSHTVFSIAVLHMKSIEDSPGTWLSYIITLAIQKEIFK